jgi:pyruvate dehydrogenase E2 component (dihydrolipoamide acetyltransferase)
MTATTVIDVAVPDIGDFSDVPVIEVLVKVGDTVAAEDALVTLESDKATMDVPAPSAGTVAEVLVAVGDKVSEGSLIMRLSGGTEAVASPPPSTPAAAPEPSRPAPIIEKPAPATNGPVYASPSVRRIARQKGIDLAQVTGTGRKGRITVADVEGWKPAAPAPAGVVSIGGLDLAPWPKVNFERFGEIERVERTRIQKISAPNLARNWVMIPHVTHNDEADITDLEAFRKAVNKEYEREGVKITMVGLLVGACVASLKAFPTFNAALDGDELVLRRYYNIGFAADTPNGLVVPVIKDADTKGILEVSRELTTLSTKARDGKLGPADIQGATFTISSLGGIGGTSFSPIINAPEVAILGVTRSYMKPVWDGSAFVPRLMVPLSLSYDHRVIDGAAAARFVVHLGKVLTDLKRALL